MGWISSQNQNLFRKLVVAYLAASILPMLFLGYVLYYVNPFDLKPYVSLILVIGVPSIVVLSLTGFFMLFISLRPIKVLTRDVEQALDEMGNLPAALNSDEIDKLSTSFVTILDELRKKVGELEAYSEQLSNVNKQLLEMSIIDELTGLYNLRYFQHRLPEELDRALRYRHEVCLIMFDIDNFKRVNDALGHSAGNAVIRELGSLVRSQVRKCDILVRYGGDEFALILPETDLKSGVKVAYRLRREIAGHKFLREGGPGEPLRITSSFGLASYTADMNGMEDLVDHADAYLYAAKEKGKNCIGSVLFEKKPSKPKV